MTHATPKGFSLTRSLCSLTLAALLGVGAVAPALASGGKASGGGVSGGGDGGGATGGGGTGGVKDGSGVTVSLAPQVLSYNGATPKGSVNLGYAADGTAQSLSFSLSAIKVPDGSVLPVRVLVGTLETIFTYYQISQVVYTETDGTITVSHGSASLSLSKLNGDIIPEFPSSAPASGTTEIQIFSPDGATLLLDGVTGSFHA